jgi:P-type Mg2+ transporter
LAALSYFLGDARAAAVIAAIVLLSVSLAFLQEHRSNHAAARLRAMVRTTATVVRRQATNRHSKFPSKSWFPEISFAYPPGT